MYKNSCTRIGEWQVYPNSQIIFQFMSLKVGTINYG